MTKSEFTKLRSYLQPSGDKLEFVANSLIRTGEYIKAKDSATKINLLGEIALEYLSSHDFPYRMYDPDPEVTISSVVYELNDFLSGDEDCELEDSNEQNWNYYLLHLLECLMMKFNVSLYNCLMSKVIQAKN
ncbi:hypothetical protein C3I27_04270 [Campylobacter jejuni]|uniref:Uncharacterized protein n=1 Tax=Campylobacter jejuni TaxID=197 RepID=A0AAX1Z4Z3_CAMJU|nr:hypothetical protein C3I27_04270 [Campylobacter jejuni]